MASFFVIYFKILLTLNKQIDIICIYNIYTLRYGGEHLDILINNSSPVALYEQIETQIKNQILNGNLKPGDPLPSIRTLAKELKVSIITSKRAYEELEKEGFIETVIGKGTFVSGSNSERLREAAMAEMEDKLEAVIISAKALGVTLDECIEILKSIYEEV